MRKRVDMSGQRFDRLTVICYDHSDSGDSLWRCRCDCGNEVVVRRQNLLSGLTKSCGCLKREIGVEKAKKMREVRKKKQTEDLTGKVFGKLTVIQRKEYQAIFADVRAEAKEFIPPEIFLPVAGGLADVGRKDQNRLISTARGLAS